MSDVVIMKPRIKKSGDTWICQCRLFVGIGDKPFLAYLDWVWWKGVNS